MGDAHHQFEHHAAKVDKTYTPRVAAAWTAGKAACGKGFRIGVIDGVVDVAHPAFKGSKIDFRSFHLKGEKMAKSGHGTRALDWMIEKKAPVVNLSIGGGPNTLISVAVNHAISTGMILVAASGNGGQFSRKKSYPGAYPPVIAITAVDRFDRSPNFSTPGDYIDFAAPGVGIWAAVPGGGKAMSGTSFAAPVVTAYAAAARKCLGIKTTDNLRAYFRKHALDRGNPGRDRYTGWGVVKLPPIC